MSKVRMLRTDAEDIEDDEVFIAHVQKMEARRLSPRWRCGSGATDFLRFALLLLFLGLDAMLAPCNLFCLVHTAFLSTQAYCYSSASTPPSKSISVISSGSSPPS